MTNLISTEQFRAELVANRAPRGPVFRISTEAPVTVEGAERTLRFCFSDQSVDRMGDTIAAAGWDLADFEANPVALWAHDSSAPPIGGARNVAVSGGRLMGDIEFAPAETYAFADTIYRLVLGKFLRAVSVGFMPTRYAFVDNDPERGWGVDFLEQSLLEISVCPVPANANALAEARSKGVDTRPLIEWAEKILDGGATELRRTLISRAELERLRTLAREPTMKRPVKRLPGQRATGAGEDDPASGGAIIGDCGRSKDEACGMKDPEECSVHAKSAKADPVDPDDEKALIAALRRLTGKRVILRADGDANPEPGDDEPPLAHEDAIRMAHKSLRTSKAYLTDAVAFHSKALSLLGDVVDSLDEAGGGDDGNSETDPDTDSPEAKAAQLARAETRRLKHAA